MSRNHGNGGSIQKYPANSILEETDPAGETDGRNLRGAVNDCVWRELNRSVSAFAESRTLSDIMQKCRELSGNWDMYVI